MNQFLLVLVQARNDLQAVSGWEFRTWLQVSRDRNEAGDKQGGDLKRWH